MEKNHRRVSYVEISLFIHATEDPDKVLKAAKNIFPEAYAEDIVFERSGLRGYYKNPIVILKAFIKERVRATTLLKNVLRRLEMDDRELLSSGFGGYVDSRGSLYIRLDKQEALLGKIRLCPVDPIHIKAKLNFLPTTLEELEANL